MRKMPSMLMTVAGFCTPGLGRRGHDGVQNRPQGCRGLRGQHIKEKADEVLTLNVTEGNHTVKIVEVKSVCS